MDHDISGVFVVEIFRNEQQVWKVWLVDNQSNWINANNGTELNNLMWKSKRMFVTASASEWSTKLWTQSTSDFTSLTFRKCLDEHFSSSGRYSKKHLKTYQNARFNSRSTQSGRTNKPVSVEDLTFGLSCNTPSKIASRVAQVILVYQKDLWGLKNVFSHAPSRHLISLFLQETRDPN